MGTARQVVRNVQGSMSGDVPDVRASARADHGHMTTTQHSHRLDPDRLADHIDRLYRAAWALCGSPVDAEDLVQETFANVLKRPRLLRDDNELGYLLGALRNTHAGRYRAAAVRPPTRQLLEEDAMACDGTAPDVRELMQAIARAPAPYRDAVIAVDVLGLSYREAARTSHTREATIASRLHRGREHVAGQLSPTQLREAL